MRSLLRCALIVLVIGGFMAGVARGAPPAAPCNPNEGRWDISTSAATFYICASDGLSWVAINSGVSFSGAYADLTGKPTLGTAAATASTDYLAASGTAADVNPAGTGIASALSGKLGTSGTAADVNPAGTSIASALSGKLGTSGIAADVNPAGTSIASALSGKQAAGTYATGTGTASGTNTGDQTTVSGNAGSATILATARAINGVNFDGSAPITVTAAGSTLSDTVTVGKGGTGLTTLTAHALYVGNTTSAPTALAVCGTGTYVRGATGADPICSTLTLPNTVVAGDTLIATGTNAVGVVTAPAIGQVYASKGVGIAPAFVTYALTHANPANQTGNATATFKMNGLGAAAAPCTITPTATGRVVFTITGNVSNGTTADSATWKLAYGTGAAPANAAAATGTIISATGVFKALTGMLTVPFSVTSMATGLALSTAVWYDLQLADITGGTAVVTVVDCTAHEI